MQVSVFLRDFTSRFVLFSAVIGLLAQCSNKSSDPIQVTVQRGEFNQPAIEIVRAPEGKADELLIETQGYEQAKDRLLQMDVLRRLGRGQLAELLGAQSPNAESRDRFMFGLGLPQAVTRKTEHYAKNYQEATKFLEAFSRGVNRRIAELETQDVALLKTYRQLTRDLNYVPRNWEPADSLAVAQNIAFYLSSRLQSKLSLGIVSMTSDDMKLPWSLPDPFKLSESLDTRSVIPTFILDADSRQNPWLARLQALRSAGGPKRKDDGATFRLPLLSCVGDGFPIPTCGQEVTVGSNSFVAGRSYTQNGDVILGNDPHLLLALPMTFYEGAYDSTPAGGSYKVRGFNLPGLPLVLIGHNTSLAWGLTNLAADVDDVYLEFLRGKNKNEILRTRNGKNETIRVTSETYPLFVRDRFGRVDRKEVVVRSVDGHGTIFTDHEDTLKQKLGSAEKVFGFHLAASYKWVGHEPTGEFEAIVGMGRASTYRESVEALKNFGVGAQNVLIGTRTGDIGYYAHGLFPVRPYVNDRQPPFVPIVNLEGQEKEWAPEWRTEIPQLYNPESDRIVTANNDPFGHSASPRLSEWEDYFSVWFSPGVRAARIQTILEGLKGKLTLETASAAQLDHKDLMMDSLLALVRPLLAKKELKLSVAAQDFTTKLCAWDATMEAPLSEPVMGETWLDELLGIYMRKYVSLSESDSAIHARKQTTLLVRTVFHKLEDFLNSDKRKEAIEVLEKSLTAASERYLAQPAESQTWGQQHRLEFANALDGILPSFTSLSFPRHGSAFTVDVSHGPVGPGFRMLVRVPESGAIQAVASVPGGNYGSTDTRNIYRELTPWLKGQYRALVPFIHE